MGSWHRDVADGRAVRDRDSAELLAGAADLAGQALDITDSLLSSGSTPVSCTVTLADLADSCLDLRNTILREGTPVMNRLIDTLLHGLGREAAGREAQSGSVH